MAGEWTPGAELCTHGPWDSGPPSPTIDKARDTSRTATDQPIWNTLTTVELALSSGLEEEMGRKQANFRV